MNKNIRVTMPSAEVMEKVIRAREAIASQQHRTIKCPYCQRNAIVVFQDARGHIQTKCKHCGREVVFDVLNMRRKRKTF